MRLQFEWQATGQHTPAPSSTNPCSASQTSAGRGLSLSKTRPNWQQWRQAAAVISSATPARPYSTLPGLALGLPAIKSTQDIGRTRSLPMRHNISNFMLIWVARQKLCAPQPVTEAGSGSGVGVWVRAKVRIFFCVIVSFYWFILPVSALAGLVFVFLFYHLWILFVCLFLIRFIYFYLCWAVVTFPFAAAFDADEI